MNLHSPRGSKKTQVTNPVVQLACSIVAGGRAHGAQVELASRIGVIPTSVWNWLHGKPVPQGHCPAIELVTGGQVTCEQLRDDLPWFRVPDDKWPHPSGRPVVDEATLVVRRLAALSLQGAAEKVAA